MQWFLKKVKYPKFFLLFLTFFIAYALFSARFFLPLRLFLLSLDYLGVFLSGIFFVYGFTAAPATAALLVLAKQENIILAGLLGGFGSLIGDLLIFKIIRHSFEDEIEKLSKEKAILEIGQKTPGQLKKYIVPVIAGFIIASPLPDEIGVSLFAISKNISMVKFAVFSYLLNTFGIFVILLIGNTI